MSSAGSLYDTLGVEADASADDIKKAYRRLSMTFHPDRHLEFDEKQAAARQWLQISAAYDVLADGQKRLVYDELGAEHLEQGYALMRSEGITDDAEELHRRWRSAQAHAYETGQTARMGVSGGATLSCSAAQLFQPSDPDMPLSQRLVPELSSVATTTDISMRLAPRNSLSFSSQALTKAGLGGSTLRVGFKRTLSARSTVQLATSLGRGPLGLDLAASRRLSARSQGTASASLSPRGIASLTYTLSRQLSATLRGEVALTLPSASLVRVAPLRLLPWRLCAIAGEESALKFELSRTARKRHREASGEDGAESAGGAGAAEAGAAAAADAATGDGDAGSGGGGASSSPLPAAALRRLLASLASLASLAALPAQLSLARAAAAARLRRRLAHSGAEITLGASGWRYGGTASWRHSKRSQTKLAGSLGLGSFSLTLSTDRAISLASSSALGVGLQLSERGLVLKLRLQRHQQRLVLPIYLLASPSRRELMLVAAAPAAALAAARRFLVEPLRARRKRKQARREAAEAKAAEAKAEESRRQALAERRLLERDAAARAAEEERAGGLVVLAAYYGDVDAALDAAARGEAEGDEAEADGGEAGTEAARRRGWVDVKVPLQFVVSSGELRLPPRSKRHLRGFAAPWPEHAAPAEPPDTLREALRTASRAAAPAAGAPPGRVCELWLRFRLGSEIRTARLADEAPLHIRV